MNSLKAEDRKKILFLTTILPRKLRMGSEVASQCFIDALTHLGYEVDVVGYMRRDDVFEATSNEIVIDQRYIETKRAKFYVVLWLGLSFLLGLPYSSGKYYSRAYIKTVKTLLDHHSYHAVFIDHPQLGWLEPLIKDKKHLITISHNIEHEIYRNSSQTTRHLIARWIYQREAVLIKKLEDGIAAQAREVWALTLHDANYFNQLKQVGNVKAFALPPGIKQVEHQCIDKKIDVGMIGSWAWKPNQEGLEWFFSHVYPLLPVEWSIHIAGRGADWLVGQYPNVEYRGFVPDAQVFMATSRVVVIPTLSGGGIQIKTLDAIASGSRIVATPIALRGISDPPSTVQVAEHPKDFATHLISAVKMPVSTSASQEASDWFKARREQFLVDIKQAIADL
jgi:polysaccharide biosynthesis protein PslH